MTQNASLKRSVPDPQPDATRTSRIDAWLDAAVAEQAARNAGAARDPRSGSAPPAIPAPAPAVQSEPSRPTERSSDGAPSPLEDSLRDFESRIRTISDRLAAPRPAPRPVPASVPEIEAAITEIRAHKAQLEAGTALGRAPSHAVSASRPRAMPQVESLRKEIAGLRGTIGSLARREDLGDVERSVAHLADQVAALREDGVAPARLDELRADIARMAEIGAPVDHTKLARSIDILSHKLDMAAVGGSVDATSLAPLTRQIDELRSLLAGLATPDDMRAIADQIGALRASLGEIAQRQVPASEVQALRQAVEGLGARLDRTGPGSGPDMSRMQDMLVLLADKLDRVESRVSDPAALDALEQQIAAMAGLGAGSGPRDPALATLETAMSRLLGEVATWRETTVELADRAARTALDAARDEAAMPTGSGEGAGFAARLATLRDAQDALAARTLERLDKVQLALDDLARRMDTTPARTEPHVAESRAGAAAVAKDELPLRPAAPKPDRNDRRASAALPDEADRPLPPPVPEDEILLEPGQRPGAARPTAPSPDADGREIKSSFIAAARRAAQAAAAEASAGRTKGGARAPELPPLKSGEGSPADLRARIKHAFERHRRPLLIGAAAIILALGGLQLGRGFLGGTSVQQAAAPAPAPVVTKPVADPTTTQSLAERPARPAPAPTPSPAPVAEPVAPAQSATAEPAEPGKPQAALSAPTPSSTPSRPNATEPVPSSPVAAIRQAAAAGNGPALFELAVRTAEGNGIPRDFKEAASLFEKAADKGIVPAQFRLGNIHEKGLGVPRNLDLAKTWYRRAAEGGNVRAMHNLAVLIAEGGGGKPDYAGAATWFEKAAERGVKDSQYNLAVLYARGLGVAQDMAKSYLYFALAAGQGDEDAGKKRDEVGGRLSAPELAKAKAAVERWRALPGVPGANEAPPVVTGGGVAAEAPTKRPARS